MKNKTMTDVINELSQMSKDEVKTLWESQDWHNNDMYSKTITMDEFRMTLYSELGLRGLSVIWK